MTWIQIVQNEKYEKVFEKANEMINRVGIFMKKYKNIGISLDQAKSEFDDGYKKLLPSGHSILKTCSDLLEIGAQQSASNKIPELSEANVIPLPSSDESSEEANDETTA